MVCRSISNVEISGNPKILVLNLPSPPYQNVNRDWAGGFGTAYDCKKRSDYGHAGKITLHSFLPYVSSVLAGAEYEFVILDCQRLKLTSSQVLKNVKKERPDIIVSYIGLPSIYKDLELMNKIKETLPHAPIIGVGTVCRVMPDEVLLNSNIDAVLRNGFPYVSNLVELIQVFQKKADPRNVNGVSYLKSGRVVNIPELPSKNSNGFPSPYYDALDLDGYAEFIDAEGNQYPFVSIIGSKGCPFSCSYCPYRVGFGTKWVPKSTKEIVDEIEYLHRIRGIEGFLFRDQIFTYNKKHLVNLCDEIIRRKLDVAWHCEARADQVSEELLIKMKKAGCKRVHFGVETGDPDLLRAFKPGLSLDAIRKAFHLTKKLHLYRVAETILGFPGESWETLKRTCRFISGLDPDDVWWNVITPYPGTEFFERARRNSWILTYDWSKYTSHTVVIKTEKLSTMELQQAVENIDHEFHRRYVKKFVKHILHGKYKFLIAGAKEVFNRWVG